MPYIPPEVVVQARATEIKVRLNEKEAAHLNRQVENAACPVKPTCGT